jgi:hypothetical protein
MKRYLDGLTQDEFNQIMYEYVKTKPSIEQYAEFFRVLDNVFPLI